MKAHVMKEVHVSEYEIDIDSRQRFYLYDVNIVTNH